MAKKHINYQEKVARHVAARAEQIAEEIAGKWGDPTNSRKIDPDKELEMWNLRLHSDPNTGETIDPNIILHRNLDLGMSPEDAMTATMDAVYPMRRRLMVTQAGPNPEDRVKYAEKMVQKSKGYTAPDYVANAEAEEEY